MFFFSLLWKLMKIMLRHFLLIASEMFTFYRALPFTLHDLLFSLLHAMQWKWKKYILWYRPGQILFLIIFMDKQAGQLCLLTWRWAKLSQHSMWKILVKGSLKDKRNHYQFSPLQPPWRWCPSGKVMHLAEGEGDGGQSSSL